MIPIFGLHKIGLVEWADLIPFWGFCCGGRRGEGVYLCVPVFERVVVLAFLGGRGRGGTRAIRNL